MRIKYYRLSKDERRKYRNKVYSSSKGKRLVKYTNITITISLMLFVIGIYYIFDNAFNNNNYLYYIYAAMIILVSIIMMISAYRLRIKTINDYIIKNSH